MDKEAIKKPRKKNTKLSPVDIDLMKKRILQVNTTGGNLQQVADEFNVTRRLVRMYASKLPGYVAPETSRNYHPGKEMSFTKAKGLKLGRAVFEAYVKQHQYLTMLVEDGRIPPVAWGEPNYFEFEGFKFNQAKVDVLYDWCYDRGYIQHSRRELINVIHKINGVLGQLEKKAKRVEKMLQEQQNDV